MKFIHTVTVTGADDSTNIGEMFEIQQKYPFVEFGILLSEKYSMHDGNNRFPSKKWLRELIEICDTEPTNLNLSGHICGKWVKETLNGKFPELQSIHKSFGYHFDRFQLNTHATPHKVNMDALSHVLNTLNHDVQTIIFQLDGINDIMQPCLDRGHHNIAGLFDLSHGAGVLPSEWPSARKNVSLGYAGGLSPANVVSQIEKIKEKVGDNTVWIDAETHLRSADDRIFDLAKVRDFLDNARPFVIE